MSFLRPVVFSDIPENLEVAEGLGVPFRCGSVDDLAAKLDYTLSHEGELESLRQATMNRLAQEYNWDRVTDRYLRIYHDAATA